MIDLQQFCYTGTDKPKIVTPFTIGNYTYATNRCFCIRVPRIEGAEERDVDVVKNFNSDPPVAWWDMPAPETWVRHEDHCEECGCHGYKPMVTPAGALGWKTLIYFAKLSNVKLAVPAVAVHDKPIRFTCNGAEGVAMPCAGPDDLALAKHAHDEFMARLKIGLDNLGLSL